MLQNIISKILKILIVFMIIICFILITTIFPIKFCISSFSDIKKDKFYIIDYYYDMSSWYLIGDEKGLFGEDNDFPDYFVEISNGPDPQNIVSGDVYLCTNTSFIIYGDIVEKRGNVYLLDSSGWDVLGEIKRLKGTCRPKTRKYLTIYDFKWFDYILESLGLYTNHPNY